MEPSPLPINKILQGDCIKLLKDFPEKSVDLVFADPPYNLQLQQQLYRPNRTKVEAVNDRWDQFESFEEYDEFCRAWLGACKRVLKDSGSLWVIGTYHNIYRIGSIMQDLGFWFLNDIVWIKTNPMPNFRGVRFTNAHETLIWASKFKGAKYTFNHHTMKNLNDDLQARSDWEFPTCVGPERIKENGKKAHSTQKPEALLYHVLMSSTRPGDVVLDPFFGSGTTGAVAQKLHRRWIGIEREKSYVALAQQRMESLPDDPLSEDVFALQPRRARRPRLPFGELLECGLLHPGQRLYFSLKDLDRIKKITLEEIPRAVVKADGRLALDGFEGSIHQAATYLRGNSPCNGWDYWYYEAEDGTFHLISDLREALRNAGSEPDSQDIPE